MKINIDTTAVNELQKIIAQHEEKPQNIRIYVAGMG